MEAETVTSRVYAAGTVAQGTITRVDRVVATPSTLTSLTWGWTCCLRGSCRYRGGCGYHRRAGYGRRCDRMKETVSRRLGGAGGGGSRG